MYADQLQDTIRKQRVLHHVMLELTYRCNLDCFYCYNDKAARGTPLSFEQYVRLMEDLARMQTLFLTFTGGEPMVHPRFFDLGEEARRLGFAVRVRTNGHTLTPTVARRLRDRVDPYKVEISLHGASAATHDRQTRVPGSFRRLLANVRGMRELGLRQRLICTPTAWNEHELEQIRELADSLGVEFSWQGPVGPRDNGDTEPLVIQPSPAAWQTVRAIDARRRAAAGSEDRRIPALDLTHRKSGQQQPERLCGIGTVGVDIDPFGNVHPCMHIKRSAGSLHEKSIGQIWYGLEGRQVLAAAEQLSLDAAQRFQDKPVEQHGAPLFCVAVEINSAKGCASGGCAGGGCKDPATETGARL